MFKPRSSTARLSALSFNRLLPNMLTLMALSAGLTSIRFALHGKWQHAVGLILVAAVLDGLDGRVARLLKSTSKFGAELDSLADFLSFGVAPAMVLYFWTMQGAGGFGWAVVLLYAICCALRLARFNTMIGQPDLPPWAHNFFTGIPAPAGATLVLVPVMMSFELDWPALQNPLFVTIFLGGVAFLMVSTLPTFSFKKIKIRPAYVLPIFLLVGVLGAFLITEPWLTLSVMALLYVSTIPFSVRRFRSLKSQAETLRAPHPSSDRVE